MKNKLIIEISGGVLVGVYTDANLDIILYDYDNMYAGDTKQTIETEPLGRFIDRIFSEKK